MREIGVIIPILDMEIDAKFAQAKNLGVTTCQVNCWNRKFMTADVAKIIVESAKKYDIKISAFWCGWEAGPRVWDFYQGPITLGLLPREYRNDRINQLVEGSEFAKLLGVTDIATHVGFLPENPATTEYNEIVSVIRYIAEIYKSNGQYFLFETGQETPVTLRRTIEDVGTGNLGINLDPANLIMYGKANPIDALTVFGKYVRGIHGKDGNYPTDGKNLGKEMPMGQGSVNYPAFMAKLKEVGYNGSITIEREIFGEQQSIDIIAARKLLESLM
ncbi:MAG: sugar phosphate isomerase/epimerase family protein [Bacillota bacterium]|nr:sugar phosphate isomerase/epimerase family protein [Bacillota bacterium]